MKRPCVYILASRRNGTLYTGVTSNLAARVEEHRQGRASKFTRKYGVTRLVHFELFEEIGEAILREKRIKKWKRAWKLDLIEQYNPDWKDVSGEIPYD
ncbi:GIY-YIG nuclease family protein [Hyphobacterium indicum]|uniref:GIY-YIG nuclease family protein n=1 Tax=Hyphobacterium indicum TaxID=2162714 RepID=UPI000D647322|nr:GIY-YIG nuclease family protein [Hyphobacterium indicum]